MYSHWVVYVLQAEGDIVIFFVDQSTVRYVVSIIVVGLVLTQVVVGQNWFTVVWITILWDRNIPRLWWYGMAMVLHRLI